MKSEDIIAFHTDLNIEDCVRRLDDATDAEQLTLFSLSGFKGDKPVLCRRDGYFFTLRKRIYWRNDFAPVFYGALSETGRGTLIEGYFDFDRWVRVFMRIWMVFVSASVPLFLVLWLLSPTEDRSLIFEQWPFLFVPPAMLLWGWALPRIGRWFSKGTESHLQEFIDRTFIARQDREPQTESADREVRVTHPLA